ncbi:MAG: hypothetical protein L0215_12590 [Gemmataceae bacterium]|nr:hypothetical protein [Gemmataceae bacterium]
MNLVNGWMFTGLGPYYMKDSSTAQNIMAAGAAVSFGGRGVADVLNSVGSMVANIKKPQSAIIDPRTALEIAQEYQLLFDKEGKPAPLVLPSHAEIHVYEPVMVEGFVDWKRVVNHQFDRHILGITKKTTFRPLGATGIQKGTDDKPDPEPKKAKPNPMENGPAVSGVRVDEHGFQVIAPLVVTHVNEDKKLIKGQEPGKTETTETGKDASKGKTTSEEPDPIEGAMLKGMAGRVEQIVGGMKSEEKTKQSGILSTAAGGGGNNVTVNIRPRMQHQWPVLTACKGVVEKHLRLSRPQIGAVNGPSVISEEEDAPMVAAPIATQLLQGSPSQRTVFGKLP